jgi:hypothetical protein
MATSAVPAVIDALVALSDAALSTVTVYDGFGVSDDPGDFLMIGVDDPDSGDAASSTDSSQQAATLGTGRARDETGEVTCVALSWNGNGDQKAARDAVFATTAAVETLCRSNPSLSITGYPLLVVGFGATQRLMQNQDEDGAEAAVFFSVRFRARL